MVDGGRRFLEESVGALRVLLRRREFILRTRDLVPHGLRADGGEREAQVRHGLLHGPQLIRRIVDREIRLPADAMEVSAQDAEALAVKRAHVDTAGRRPTQVHDAFAHLVRRPVGEGDGENVPGGHTVRDEPGDAMGNDARLASAGPGEDKQRTNEMLDRRALLWIQPVSRSCV